MWASKGRKYLWELLWPGQVSNNKPEQTKQPTNCPAVSAATSRRTKSETSLVGKRIDWRSSYSIVGMRAHAKTRGIYNSGKKTSLAPISDWRFFSFSLSLSLDPWPWLWIVQKERKRERERERETVRSYYCHCYWLYACMHVLNPATGQVRKVR